MNADIDSEKLLLAYFGMRIRNINTKTSEQKLLSLISYRIVQLTSKQWTDEDEIIFNTLLSINPKFEEAFQSFEEEAPGISIKQLHKKYLNVPIDQIIASIKVKKVSARTRS